MASADEGAPPLVIDEPERNRLVVDGGTATVAEIDYEVGDGRLYVFHTEVPEELRGRGLAGHLATAAVSKAKAEKLTLVPWCPFVRRWLAEDPSRADGVPVDLFVLPPES